MTARTGPRFRFGLIAAAFLGLLAVAAWLAMERGTPRVAEPRQSSLIAGTFDPPRMAPDFSLAGSDGSQVSLARYHGKIVLLTFGFTHCAAVCPTTLATLAQARAQLGKAADAVQVIYVTVDPDRDDVAHMKPYLAAFDPAFLGATGDPRTLASVRQHYGVTAIKEGSGPDYAVAHTSSIFLVDRAGRLRALMPFGHDAADFVHDIRFLLTH